MMLLTVLLSLMPLAMSSAQEQERPIQCRQGAADAGEVSDAFVEGYVAAFGYPEGRGFTSHRQYVENQIQSRISYLHQYLATHHCERLSDVDVFAISIYTGSQYQLLNGALRSGDPAALAKYQFLIDAINAGLDKLEPYEGTVRRGVNLTPAQAKVYCRGCTVTEKGFTSTTLNSSYSKRKYQFVMTSKTGAYIAPISSAGPIEEEVLFKSGTHFKVTKIQKNVITMEEVQ